MVNSVSKDISDTSLHRGPVRFITATSLFDGHDAAINIMRRILLDQGAEIIHLGHNHSARDIVRTAVQEDADAIAVSSYQGGHMEFFPYILELLKEAGADHVQLFGGGGGVIVPREIKELEAQGVAKIYSPEDGRRLGLVGMIEDMVERTRSVRQPLLTEAHYNLTDEVSLARCLSVVEATAEDNLKSIWELLKQIDAKATGKTPPVIGVTGTGGAGKSSLVDEILLRFLHDFPEKRVAILSCDPTRKRTGGALLGDRIRINSAASDRVFLRSMATRSHAGEISGAVAEALSVLRRADFDLIITETAGAGQSDAAIAPLVDVALYVMTPEYGAATQLEKIGMLDYADLICINKFDRAGAGDALHDVRKQYQRNHHCFEATPEDMPVYGAIASRFNDAGVTALYHGLLETLNKKCNAAFNSTLPKPKNKYSTDTTVVVPHDRINYLSEIAHTVREYRKFADAQGRIASNIWRLAGAATLINNESTCQTLNDEIARQSCNLDGRCKALLEAYPPLKEAYTQNEFRYTVRGREICAPLSKESLAGNPIPRVALPHYENEGDLLRWLLLENLPGYFPYTAGCFPLKRSDEAATRMFAGEGDPKRTNTRFKYLSKDAPAKRLSTAFDSVTLYGQDPDERPDIYGKIGSSGVSICTLEDMQQLFDGFDLCAPNTSVSMTINGPAPIILAMFFNAAIEQQCARHEQEHGHKTTAVERASISDAVLKQVRGTVQADILKEDQGQNTCLFAIDFGLKMMGDVQEFFLRKSVRNFYSVSVSGYHIAEAGANPITQLAFTLANGFTYVEYYLSRGMDINAFAPNLSFFFSCGMDPEYAVLNRVARRIWAVTLRDRYNADERAQKLKAHIQTSGRSLHAQEIHFNDIRTTLQALTAYYDQCNSLHTNAYDEAVTTPTEESVRRALAIQQIITKEHGLAFNENPLQGSFIIEELTTLVEEAVLAEFERLCSRGGVLGAMERGYQRSEIQEESLKYEHLKSSGDYPIVGVNTFINPDIDHEETINSLELRRGTKEEKRGQVDKLVAFHRQHADKAPGALKALQETCLAGDNIFAELMETVRTCSLGQITQALFEVGGQYRRNA
jgi:isobutyryl-CoA mutase